MSTHKSHPTDIKWCVPAFCVIYLAHFVLYKSLPFLMSLVVDEKSARVVSSKINLMKLSRFAIDTIIMMIFSCLGFMVLEDFHGWENFVTDGTQAVERAFMPSSVAVVLCRLQVAYELKNLLDSCIFGDGAVFVVHHICTGTLAVFALHPFLHIYSSFFFGISEVSTVVLCVLACFDDSRGISAKDGSNLFAKLFPVSMKVIGVAFAVLFVIIRIIVWPIVSYYFWIDSIALLENPEKTHSFPVVYTFLVFNVGLTVLQFAWLAEIIMLAIPLFSGSGVKSSITSTLDEGAIVPSSSSKNRNKKAVVAPKGEPPRRVLRSRKAQ